ncbi:hypothetical protein CL653_02030 [bacterium]|nr:hypothetical protein [bacterium]
MLESIADVMETKYNHRRTAIPMSVKHCGWDDKLQQVDYRNGCGGFDVSDHLMQQYLKENNILESNARCICKSLNEIEREQDRRRISDANIPNQTAPRRFDNFIPVDGSEQTVLALREFLDGKGKVLVIAGVVGSGKSHLVEATARHLFHRGVRVRYIEWANYMDEMRKAEMNNTKYDLYDRYEIYNTVILDDVGVGRSKEYTSEELTKLFENRMNHGTMENHRLIITTNLNRSEMAYQFDERLASRLFQTETDTFKQVAMRSTDYRITRAS